jgi:two-component system, NtrC family, sensor kinase
MDPLATIPATYDYRLVVLSVAIAIFASYAALDLAGRVTASQGRARLAWLSGGAVAMGGGIWCMHYTGMLAYRLPLRVFYHVPTVLLSLLAAVGASLVALFVVSRPRMTAIHVAAGSILMGAGIATMHYVGMAAMRLRAIEHYDPGLWLLSVLLAVLISLAAVLLIFRFQDENQSKGFKCLVAMVMGMAIPVMHYTGMAAVSFTPANVAPNLSHAVDISVLASEGIILMMVLVLGFALLTSLVDRHFAAQARELALSEQRYQLLFDNSPQATFVFDPASLRVETINQAAIEIYGFSAQEFLASRITDLHPSHSLAGVFGAKTTERASEAEHCRKDGTPISVEVRTRVITWRGRHAALLLASDISERKAAERARDEMEIQLRHAQKLESIGQLAAGIAHEINTPTQFIGDNVRFLQDAFKDLHMLLTRYERLLTADKSNGVPADNAKALAEAAVETDIEELIDEIPKAILEALDGVGRVATIVQAMKEFSHPGSKEKMPWNLNHAIESTITVARNEWKYVADLETHFDPALPLVPCLAGEINQVVLNLIVNAVHAIEERTKQGGPQKGKIIVQTVDCKDWAEIRVTDTGAGIPEAARPRIFDPFFTTKEVGKGTGQGLAIARSVVVDKHQGTIHFETAAEKGTTFVVRLPYAGRAIPTLLTPSTAASSAGR